VRARPALLLLAFLLALLLAWAHPAELQRAPDHACGGGAHLAGGDGPSHHPAHGCAACDLLHAPLLAADAGPSGPRRLLALGRAGPRGPARPRLPVPLGFAPRGPPV
jgi:hypothetical protein